MSNTNQLFTVGHSNLSIDAFIALLQQYGITAVADVRSHPYSRYFPHFNQSALKAALLNAGIRYVFLGKELGARPANQSCYVDGKALYEKIAATELFSEGIQQLLKEVEKYKVSIMCAEQDPISCHRTILICQHLRDDDLEIKHILKNGGLESHKHLEDRLLGLQRLNYLELSESTPKQLSLFENPPLQEPVIETDLRETCIQEAYKRHGDQIAYVEKKNNRYEKNN